MRTTLSITATSASDGKAYTKSYGNIVQGYIGVIGGQAPALPWAVDEDGDITRQTGTFAEWTDAVARGINTLTNDTYSDATVACSLSVNDELAGE